MVGALAWGSVSDWVAGLATAAAVVVALVFSLRTERQQRDSTLAAVHAWFELALGKDAARTGTLRLINATSYPVYEWSVEVRWADGAMGVATSQADHGLLPPGDHHFALSADGLDLPGNDADVQVDLRFRDAEGHARHRLPTGRLVTARG